MSDNQPNVIYLKDYQVPSYLIERTALDFHLGEDTTKVTAVLKVTKNPECKLDNPTFDLFGHDSLEAELMQIDGEAVIEDNMVRNGEVLSIAKVPESFEFKCVTVIKPQ